ncbi:hypothetical protein [Vallitalea okinawensis]|nr:hypothetical protein [Vallitalea okinawensis]
MKGIMEFYDKTCSEWASRFYKDESIFPCLENFINRFPQKPRILD